MPVLTSFSDFARIDAAIAAGAVGYLLKDVDAAALSPREADVLRLVVEGLLKKQIAQRLGITERTVKAHLTSATSASASPIAPRLPSGHSATTSAAPRPRGPGGQPSPAMSSLSSNRSSWSRTRSVFRSPDFIT